MVRKGYAERASQGASCCSRSSCCGGGSALEMSRAVGYTDRDMESVPDEANLGLGCGNPTALASLKEGETVIDLGCGAGFDVFLAANKVGAEGKVIGVDMTPEMLDKAKRNVRNGGYSNVEFRLGEIENLPVANGIADAVISNCVINLSPEKEKVFGEAFRALKPGGRLMVSDMVLTRELPEKVRSSIEAYVGCIAGASLKDDYLAMIKKAGFKDVRIEDEKGMGNFENDPIAEQLTQESGLSEDELKEIGRSVLSISVYGTKPS